tara:strand:+ start:435 stop:656 length:222 start_codon:yes stop_codon:yes gene_type:complete
MVIGTFLIAFNLASIGKQDKEYIERRDDCADVSASVITEDSIVKKYKIGEVIEGYLDKSFYVDKFCSFYRKIY